jgi:hypothetical protein
MESRMKAKDQEESTIDVHTKMENRDIKGGVPTSQPLLLQFERENNVPRVHGNYILLILLVT